MSPDISLTGKRWLQPDESLRSQSSADLIARLLKQRQITVSRTADLTPPAVFPDLEKAVGRIQGAVERKEQVMIFGDYDCDGITATAQMVRYFRRHGLEPRIRLPHREHDGYGLQTGIVREAIEASIRLLITVDTGIASAAEIAEAISAGIDVIVTDHHQAPARIPEAFAIIHPALAPEYPHPYPSGAGVVFQLLRALEGRPWNDIETDAALAMIGTVADIVELRGDNRIIVQMGLQALRRRRQGPLHELLAACDIDPATMTSIDVAFRVAPRINAAGRLHDPLVALDALLEGGEAVTEICSLNSERQKQTEDWFKIAAADVGLSGATHDHLPPLLASLNADYPAGIVGLIAGRLTEQTGRPTLIGTILDGQCVASLRSPPCYHITDGMTRYAHHLERFGGHAQAAGCTLVVDNWNAFVDELRADIAATVSPADLQPCLQLDAEVNPTDVSLTFLDALKQLEPYGQGNSEPLFLLPDVRLSALRAVGQDGKHLQARLGELKAIGFGLGHLEKDCDGPLDLACRLSIDTWNGTARPQLVIVDARVAL